MTVHSTARFSIKPEALDRAVEAIGEFVERIRENEPRTLLYLSLQEKENPTRFLHVMAFEDEQAERHHTGTEWVKSFTDVLYPETIGVVEFTGYTRVAST